MIYVTDGIFTNYKKDDKKLKGKNRRYLLKMRAINRIRTAYIFLKNRGFKQYWENN